MYDGCTRTFGLFKICPCPWSKHTSETSLKYADCHYRSKGYLEQEDIACLKYTWKNGCHRNEEALTTIHPECLKYILDKIDHDWDD